MPFSWLVRQAMELKKPLPIQPSKLQQTVLRPASVRQSHKPDCHCGRRVRSLQGLCAPGLTSYGCPRVGKEPATSMAATHLGNACHLEVAFIEL